MKLMSIIKNLMYNIDVGKGWYVMESKYEAVELANEVVSLANENNMYISNLQLQKIMYYIQGEYMKKFGIKAFGDDIECWPYGPVIKKVWKIFNLFGRKPICDCVSMLKLEKIEKELIIKILKEKLTLNVWDLVDQTHNELPWKNANQNNWAIIRDEDMERFFCQ